MGVRPRTGRARQSSPRRPLGRRSARAGDARGPAPGGRRRAGRDRLVPPLADGAPGRVRRLRGRRRAQRAAGARRRHRPAPPDEIPDTRAASVAWLPGDDAFLYARYPEGDEYDRRIYDTSRPPVEPPTRGRGTTCPTRGVDRRRRLPGRPLRAGAPPSLEPDRRSPPRPRTGEWRTVIAASTPRRKRFDGDRLLGGTTLDAPAGAWSSSRSDDPAAGRLGDPRARGRRRRRRRHAGRCRRLLVRPHAARRVPRLRRHAAAAAPRPARWRSPSWARSPGSTRRGTAGGVFLQIESFTRPPSPASGWTPGRGLAPPWSSGCRRRSRPAFTVTPRDLPVARRHRDRPVPDAPADVEPARTPRHPHRLRRLRHRRDAGVVADDRRLVRAGRPVRGRRPARRRTRTARRGTTPAAGAQAERVRRLPRRRRPPGRDGPDVARPPGDPGRLERRAARGRRAHPAPRPVPRPCTARCRCSTWCASRSS